MVMMPRTTCAASACHDLVRPDHPREPGQRGRGLSPAEFELVRCLATGGIRRNRIWRVTSRSGTAQYSNAFHAPIIRRHPRPGSNLTGHAESGLRATGDAFPLVPDVDDNLIGTQKEPGLKDRARARGAVLLVPAIWAALDRPSSLSPVPTVICHCDELRRAAGLLGYGVDRVTHRSTGLESPTGGPSHPPAARKHRRRSLCPDPPAFITVSIRP